MITHMLILSLKRRARRAYLRYLYEVDLYDCGAHVAENINPRILPAKQKFNELMDKLSGIDPSTPVLRLK